MKVPTAAPTPTLTQAPTFAPYFFAMASARDVEMAVEAVKVNGLWLAVLREDLRAEREVVHEAVQQNGLALEHAEKSLRSDKDIVLTAAARPCSRVRG